MMMETFWVKFNFGNGKFVEREFNSDGELYDYILAHQIEIKDWKRIRKTDE